MPIENSKSVLAIQKWLIEHVEKAEALDPKLRELKESVDALSQAASAAKPENRPEIMNKLDSAIQKLLAHVST